MKNELPDWDLRNEELEDRLLRERAPLPAKRPTASPSRLRKRPRRRTNVLPLAAAAAALVLITAALTFALRRDRDTEPEPLPEPPPEEESVTFLFGDRVLTAIDGIPLNTYNKDAFGLDEKGRITCEENDYQARTGIDVSTHQKDIDWNAVAADGIDFAILRLGYRGYTEGKLFTDQTFEQNLRGALGAGLDIGVYFFSQAVTPEEAAEEADYVLSVLDGQELALPVTFDWEFIPDAETRTAEMGGEMITRCAAAFCGRIAEAGYTPAVYFNRTQAYLFYGLSELQGYDWWLAEYDSIPDFYYHFNLWQYSDRGQVAGIQGAVDMDLAFVPR